MCLQSGNLTFSVQWVFLTSVRPVGCETFCLISVKSAPCGGEERGGKKRAQSEFPPSVSVQQVWCHISAIVVGRKKTVKNDGLDENN